MSSWLKVTVLFWSTFSGAVMGLLAGVVLGAALFTMLGMLPARWEAARLRLVAATVCLVLLPLCGATLGFLEGRLKLS